MKENEEKNQSAMCVYVRIQVECGMKLTMDKMGSRIEHVVALVVGPFTNTYEHILIRHFVSTS